MLPSPPYSELFDSLQSRWLSLELLERKTNLSFQDGWWMEAGLSVQPELDVPEAHSANRLFCIHFYRYKKTYFLHNLKTIYGVSRIRQSIDF